LYETQLEGAEKKIRFEFQEIRSMTYEAQFRYVVVLFTRDRIEERTRTKRKEVAKKIKTQINKKLNTLLKFSDRDLNRAPSFRGEVVRDLWCTERHWGRSPPSTSVFPSNPQPTKCSLCRSQWPRGLRHELSSPARTAGSWVRIPIKA
jgi:hypothetical protein